MGICILTDRAPAIHTRHKINAVADPVIGKVGRKGKIPRGRRGEINIRDNWKQRRKYKRKADKKWMCYHCVSRITDGNLELTDDLSATYHICVWSQRGTEEVDRWHHTVTTTSRWVYHHFDSGSRLSRFCSLFFSHSAYNFHSDAKGSARSACDHNETEKSY